MEPRALAFNIIEHRGWRASEPGQAALEIGELREQRFGLEVRCVWCGRPSLECARDRAETLGLVDGKAQEPAVPVAELHASKLTPPISSFACPVIERYFGRKLGAGLAAPLHGSVASWRAQNVLVRRAPSGLAWTWCPLVNPHPPDAQIEIAFIR